MLRLDRQRTSSLPFVDCLVCYALKAWVGKGPVEALLLVVLQWGLPGQKCEA
jgi:hypothetical protein